MSKLEFSIAKGTLECLECGDYRIPYKNKENISWNVKWNPNDNLFTFFLYVRERERIRVHADFIPNEILKAALGDKKRMNEVIEICVYRLSKLYGANWEKEK